MAHSSSRNLNFNSTMPESNSHARCPPSLKHREMPGYAAPPLIFHAGITSVFSGLVGFLAVLFLGVESICCRKPSSIRCALSTSL
jgi:hypothetical protein